MKTVIWDYNGTIIDDVQLCLDIERNMRFDFTMEDYRSMFCFPVIDYYRKIGYTFENETYDEISVEFNDMYDNGFAACRLMDGFIEKINESREKGHRNVILSAARHDKLVEQCAQLGIASFFDEILGTDNLLAGSKIDMAKRWMAKSETEPMECMFIGDTLHDYETALALGIGNIFLTCQGHQDYETLKKANAHVVHSLKEVEI